MAPPQASKATFAVDGRQGKEEAASGVGFASHLPWYLACPVLAAHLSEVPMAIGWVKCFLCRLPIPLTPVCSLGLMAYAPFPGAAEMRDEMRCLTDRCSCPLPTGGGEGSSSGPEEQSSAWPLPAALRASSSELPWPLLGWRSEGAPAVLTQL